MDKEPGQKAISVKAKTDEEHQHGIRKCFKNRKAMEMFDCLSTFGSLTRSELKTLASLNRNGYDPLNAWEELHLKRLVEEDHCYKLQRSEKRFRLSDEAFLNPREDHHVKKDTVGKELSKYAEIGGGVIKERIERDPKDEKRNSDQKEFIEVELKKEKVDAIDDKKTIQNENAEEENEDAIGVIDEKEVFDVDEVIDFDEIVDLTDDVDEHILTDDGDEYIILAKSSEDKSLFDPGMPIEDDCSDFLINNVDDKHEEQAVNGVSEGRGMIVHA